jgi:hypothetical protein
VSIAAPDCGCETPFTGTDVALLDARHPNHDIGGAGGAFLAACLE